ncbi:MAG: CDP-alcohol phosphatidyltransferase family protein [Candidatus Marinimicrobia bacterium]|nr:CDP-alcohol phosphatidyltransferase family protein [Candidatus Neomarinimicrobiota bacterium]MBT3617595.1 CDP-alcohol phosphatidyltransferase family protein [Candidatus Neomarinimicrobiota bacterium]MBT4280065.1 CDP-alcohol phosphatidyltransferase family protein [Candidatus Neomarinimicrobiota bacterium]MBT4570501.1 CDP-alcohol phosphatidyltransferase family protein [Candidatus Neomarinimicrobiota bacterium]MBT4796621.1 CDP-alcohol phosphatidyltransferase family protein [Candidatus Neomarini
MNNMNPVKIKLTDPSRILTMANMVSLIRALLVIPIIYTLRNPDWATYTFILIVIGVLSDALDGYLARRAHEVTHFGKWLDPIADFVVIFSIASYLVLIGRFPLWFYWFFLIRYVAIAIPAIYLLNQSHFILQSNWYGKWGAGISSLAIILHVFPLKHVDWLPEATLWAAAILLSVSWVMYFNTFIKEYRRQSNI